VWGWGGRVCVCVCCVRVQVNTAYGKGSEGDAASTQVCQLRHTVPHCNTLQHTATRCNTMQHDHCNTLADTHHCGARHPASFFSPILSFSVAPCLPLSHPLTHTLTLSLPLSHSQKLMREASKLVQRELVALLKHDSLIHPVANGQAAEGVYVCVACVFVCA